ncbi:hypothetical protein niasHT_009268 [Heterodera trifolii]|uniref:Uncharacterized protein n=1 Tax=Heterodera trifolii TaxID=157864 RepID=A0ABD2LYN1_9BILA
MYSFRFFLFVFLFIHFRFIGTAQIVNGQQLDSNSEQRPSNQTYSVTNVDRMSNALHSSTDNQTTALLGDETLKPSGNEANCTTTENGCELNDGKYSLRLVLIFLAVPTVLLIIVVMVGFISHKKKRRNEFHLDNGAANI